MVYMVFLALGLPHYTIPGHHNVEYFIAICMGTTSMQENGARVAGKWLLQRGKHCNYTNSSWPNFQLIICLREAPVWTMTQVPSELVANISPWKILFGSIFNLSHFWRIQNQFWCILHGAVFNFSRFLRFKIRFEAFMFNLFQHFLVFRIMFDSFWGTHFVSKVVGPQLSVSSICLPYT